MTENHMTLHHITALGRPKQVIGSDFFLVFWRFMRFKFPCFAALTSSTFGPQNKDSCSFLGVFLVFLAQISFFLHFSGKSLPKCPKRQAKPKRTRKGRSG